VTKGFQLRMGFTPNGPGPLSGFVLSTLYCLCFVNCMKFGQLVITKIIKIVATRCLISRLKCTKFDFGWGCALDPAGGAYSAPQTPQLVGRGLTAPSPRTLPPLSAFRASILRPPAVTIPPDLGVLEQNTDRFLFRKRHRV